MRLATLLTAGLLAACDRGQEVRHYRAPKEPQWRMVGAIVPAGEATWFFKVSGEAGRLGAHREELLRFLGSISLEGTELEWTLPAGWRPEQAGGHRYATVRFGNVDPQFELSVTRLPGEAGGLLANVNRWRHQMGLDPIRAEELDSLPRLELQGGQAIVLDLVGPCPPRTAGPPGVTPP